MVARNETKLEALAKELIAKYNVKATVIALDLSTPGASQTLHQEVQKQQLKVDLLINNAGFATYGYFEQVSGERQHEEVMLNVAALVDITHAFMPDLLRKRDGGSSMFLPQPHFSPILIWPYMEQPKHLCFLLLKRYGPKIGNGGLKFWPFVQAQQKRRFLILLAQVKRQLELGKLPKPL